MKILELFSGYGTASFALEQLGIDFEIVGYSDIDKYANQCFKQNHWRNMPFSLDEFGTNYTHRLGDVTKIDPHKLKDFDLLTGGFPCQAFSVAGKGLGELDTRGTLFNEIIRIAEVKKPRYMLLENVKGLMSKRHKSTFNKIISELYRIGYFVKWKVMNTKEHGIPQNRERVFFVCFKSWTDFCDYEWAEKEELKIFLKDILEEEVDEKYHLSEKQLIRLKEYCGKKNKINAEVMNCIGTCFGRSGSSSEECESYARTNKALMIGNLSRYKMKSERSMPFQEDGISWALTGDCGVGVLQDVCVQVGMMKQESERRISDCPLEINLYLKENKGDLTMQQIADKIEEPLSKVSHYFRKDSSRSIPHPNIWFKLKKVLNFDDKYDNIVTKLEKFCVEYEASRRVYSSLGCSPALMAANADKIIEHKLTIRKLTPTECFRLQGFLNDEVNLDGLSNTQRYKLAGNGQSVNVVKKIFCSLNLNKTNGGNKNG